MRIVLIRKKYKNIRKKSIQKIKKKKYNILIIKINAQHSALSKAIKTRFKIEIIYCDVSS